MKPLLYILGLFIVALSCTEEPYQCNCDITDVPKNDSIFSSDEFNENLKKFSTRYNQTPLSELADESYRLSTKHAFNKYYQVFTLTKTKKGGDFLVQEYLCSKPYANDGKLNYEHRSALSMSEWDSFKTVIEHNCFWTLSLEDPDSSEYFDGGEWYIEGFQPNKRNCSKSDYICTSRKMPSTSDRFYNVYTSLMNMVNKNEIHATE